MEVILRKTVDQLGSAGEIVKVKPGYARNYLLPQGLAYPATPGNKRRVQAEAGRRASLAATEKGDAEAFAGRLASVELTFTAKAGEADKLFGSITTADIAERLAEQGLSIDRRIIELEEPIKMIGIYKVPVRLHPEVHADVRVWVVKE
jgi:large subunit ribosomal protein L9